MKKYNSDQSNPGYALFFFGWLFVMSIGLIILQKIPSNYQPVFVFGSSLICFGMSLFKTKNSHKAINDLKVRSNWLGFTGMVLTVLLLTVLAPNSSLAIWGKISTLFFGLIFLFVAFAIVVESFFPNASIEPWKKW